MACHMRQQLPHRREGSVTTTQPVTGEVASAAEPAEGGETACWAAWYALGAGHGQREPSPGLRIRAAETGARLSLAVPPTRHAGLCQRAPGMPRAGNPQEAAPGPRQRW